MTTHATSLVTIINEAGKLETIDLTTGESVVQANLPVKFNYTIPLSEVICQHIREGKTLSQIASLEGMPNLNVLYRWRQMYPEFEDKVKAARRERAEIFHDKIVELAEREDIAKDDVPWKKTQIDTFKWLAEKNDPNSYGKTQGGGGNSSVTIVIDTGINRNVVEVKDVPTTCVSSEVEEAAVEQEDSV